MLVSIFGTPSQLTQAVLKVVQAVAAAGLGPYHWIAAGTSKDLREALASREHQHVMLFGDIPSREVVQLVVQASAPTIVVIEDTRSIVRACMSNRKMEGLQAIRFASQSLGTLHALALSPHTRVLGDADAGGLVEDLALDLANFYRIALDDTRLRALRKQLRLDALGPAPVVGSLVPSQQAGEEADELLAEQVLSGYAALNRKQRAERFEWPARVFLGANPHGQPIEGPVSLVGGKRCFLFGPFFHLPAGHWRAAIQFEVSENFSGNVLKVDVFTDRIIMEASTRLPKAGRFTCDIDFIVEEPRLPLQIRLFNDQGAIEGFFELLRIVVTRGD